MKNRKLKLLAFCDTPVCYSGFAQVSRNILAKIHEMGIFDITVWGINHVFEIDEYGRFIKPDVPYEILPAAYISAEDERKGYSSNDVFGREKLARYMFQNDFDVFWSVQDPYVIEDLIDKIINLKTRYNKNFKSIFYFPVDAYNIDHKWAEIPKYFDHPVVYTEFGKERVLERCPELKDRLKVIYHGTNTKDFYPVDKEKRNMIRESLGIPEDTCVVLNVNRNQPRKDLSRTLEVFSEFKKKVPNSKLFLFCRNQDVGGNILERAKYYGLTSKDIIFPKLPTGKDEFKGASIEEVNQSYNASDICISTTLGEGWGLSLSESMATKLPVVFPDNTSLTEIIGKNEERGFLAASGKGRSDHIQLPPANDPPRPLTDIDSMVEKMVFVWENKGRPEVLDKVNKAYEWVQDNTWDKIFERDWKPIFEKVVSDLKNNS